MSSGQVTVLEVVSPWPVAHSPQGTNSTCTDCSAFRLRETATAPSTDFYISSYSRTRSGHPWSVLIEVSFKSKLLFMGQEILFRIRLPAWNVNVWFIYKCPGNSRGCDRAKGRAPQLTSALAKPSETKLILAQGSCTLVKCNISSDFITSCHRKIIHLLRSKEIFLLKLVAESHSDISHLEGREYNTGIGCFKSPEQLHFSISAVVVSALCSFWNSNYSMSSKNSWQLRTSL